MMTNLYHNHSESKYVRFPCDHIGTLQDLWRGPCRSISVLLCCEVRSQSNRGKLKPRQTSMAAAIDKNAGLVTGSFVRPRMNQRKHLPHLSFRVWCCSREDSQDPRLRPRAWEDHVIGQVRLLGKTHQADPVRTWVFLNELYQSSIRYPLRDNLQRICCNADERDDVWVPQPFPDDGLFVK